MSPRRSGRTPKPVLKPEDNPEIEEKVKKRKASVSNGKNKATKKVKNEEPEVEEEEEAPARSVEFRFIGEPIPKEVAVARWPDRYVPELIEQIKEENTKRIKRGAKEEELEEIMEVKSHYSKAFVDGIEYNLEDDAHVLSDKPASPFICKIIEFFETVDNEAYFKAQWYYRITDTVCRDAVRKVKSDKEKCKEEELDAESRFMEEFDPENQLIEEVDVENKSKELQDAELKKKNEKNKSKNKPKTDHTVHLHPKRIFFSKVKDNNPLELLLGKVTITRIASNVDLKTKEEKIAKCDYYYDMKYELPYKSFVSIPPDTNESATSSGESGLSTVGACESAMSSGASELSLLDLYCGCGAMSTGITLGAEVGGVNLVTRWAVDVNVHACQTLELNHPETNVRNECAEDFLSLLKEWQRLVNQYVLSDESNNTAQGSEDLEEVEEVEEVAPGEFVVERFVGISFGDPKVNAANLQAKDDDDKIKATEIFFKVRWSGYDSAEDTWEPYKGLSNCEDEVREFVKMGHRSKLLPLPGDVDIICGGPPCQGISGFNRFRNDEEPLDDEKNYQMLVYMDIVKFLNPQYILMENVVDLVKFADGYLARYAVKRLLSMDYQVRLGIMAAGSFGLPQFRQRVFVWGAQIGKKIPSYPYPTHEVVVRGNTTVEFEQCLVAYDEDNKPKLHDLLLLEDAIRDLPEIQNNEEREERPYGPDPQTQFQEHIRSNREGTGRHTVLFDHIPLLLNADDYQRVCRVPRAKGANFSDIGGVRKDAKGKWELDPSIPREMLPNGKPLIPDYALSFTGGSSSKPFGRLWWDETVPTVVTRAEPHNQAIMHPTQDRVLSVRENARLQGFPDYLKLCGPVKEKYIQVGNAVAVPVAKALGFAFALAIRGVSFTEPLFKLPDNFGSTIGPLPVEALEAVDRAFEEQ
ncbi:DNA (cytosine-5)-methyltransferase CMT3-like isoform X2 [Papaver somniferum]|uniref:DNA (cytosine-5)-methyltransferase CMT3-like isoform X2 n=1 Tax=Papaver somniferum TaxID=3469 RepID=UPI000E6FDE7C|nr:DNA (cytosine-5)-methyltransferase CMT3-like isoform X2 [Papaver somniferum]